MTERYHPTPDGELSDEHDHIVEVPDAPLSGTDGPAVSDPLQGPLATDIEGPEEPSIGPADLDLLERHGTIPDAVRRSAGQEA